MNYDRLLTRVWDKQEKKMIYHDDEFKSNHHGNSPCLASYKLIGIDSCGLVATDPWKHEIGLIPFGDRFIPMQCTGEKVNKNLLWESDIIEAFIHIPSINEQYEMMIGKITCGGKDGLWFRTNNSYCTRLGDIILNDCKILSNIHENPELLEVNL